jgi:hypothetical protein
MSPASAGLNGMLSSEPITLPLQEKNAIPSMEEQIITADVGFGGLSSVKIAPIPQNYGLITYDGSTITVS